MKKYSCPNMKINNYYVNEYVSVCKDINLSCLNMNHVNIIHRDLNGNGLLDEEEKVSSNSFGFKQQNDCGKTGDPSGGLHSSDSLGELVFVGYKDNIYVPAYVVNDVHKDAPHFLDIKTVNHS